MISWCYDIDLWFGNKSKGKEKIKDAALIGKVSKATGLTPNQLKEIYQGEDGVDITSMSIDYKTSFENLKMWINSVFENSGNSQMPLVVVCNKIDLEELREVQNEEVEKLCSDESMNLKLFFKIPWGLSR